MIYNLFLLYILFKGYKPHEGVETMDYMGRGVMTVKAHLRYSQ